jgi:FkbM family methyltransferase
MTREASARTATRTPDRTAALPPAFRIAATARRVLGAHGTRALYGSSFAAPLRRLLTSSAPSGFTLVDVCGGLLAGARMHVDLSCEKYYWLGTHEEAVQSVLRAHVAPGDVAYDIGAHAGFFTLLLSRLTGPSGRVLAFEPVRDNAARLASNLSENRSTNVDLHAVALSDTTGMAPFVSERSSLQGALVPRDGASRGEAAVATTTIDDLVAAGAPPPSMMKVDVEGAEGRVLAGGRKTIARHLPKMIVEIHSPAAWGEVLDALPAPYDFSDVDATAYSPTLRMPGHYLAVPAGKKAVA